MKKTNKLEKPVVVEDAIKVSEVDPKDMPTLILDLTNEDKSIKEAIAECEAKRIALNPWHKRIAKRIKHFFVK